MVNDISLISVAALILPMIKPVGRVISKLLYNSVLLCLHYSKPLMLKYVFLTKKYKKPRKRKNTSRSIVGKMYNSLNMYIIEQTAL